MENQTKKSLATTISEARIKEPKWVKCPECGEEYGGLVEFTGICGLCTERKKTLSQNEEQKKGANERILKFLGQKGFDQYTFARFNVTLENQEAFNAAKAFEPVRDNFYFYGNCGTGKTHLAGAIFREAVAKGIDAVIYTQPQLMRLFRGKEAHEEETLLARFAKMDVFIIDDLGVGKATEFANQILYEIIGLREMGYKNGLVITSNFSLDEIMVKMGEGRFRSRVAGMCRTVRVGGKDRRIV
jgi:DNA replication protein DnaC